MNLIQLRYFYESAINQNFSKTAEKYIVPTSSVSAAIKRLEKEIGTVLFDRESNRIVLNQNGQILARALGNAFNEVETAISDIKDNLVPNREIRILVRARRAMVTDLLINYKSVNPNVKFRMSHDFDISTFDDFDIIIDEKNEPMHSSMEHFLLTIEELCIKAHSTSPLLNRKLTMKQLENQPFVMMKGESNMNRILSQNAKRCGFEPDITFLCEDRQCLLKCVKSGMGLTVGSKRALCEESQSNLKALDISDFSEYQEVYIYHRHTSGNDAVIADFLDFLLKESKK